MAGGIHVFYCEVEGSVDTMIWIWIWIEVGGGNVMVIVITRSYLQGCWACFLSLSFPFRFPSHCVPAILYLGRLLSNQHGSAQAEPMSAARKHASKQGRQAGTRHARVARRVACSCSLGLQVALWRRSADVSPRRGDHGNNNVMRIGVGRHMSSIHHKSSDNNSWYSFFFFLVSFFFICLFT